MARPSRKGKKSWRKKRMRKVANMTFSGSQIRKPFGNKLKVFTRYVDRGYTLNPGAAGTAAVQVFSANGLYDPDITGTGHQPIGFDQYMTAFDHYTVIGAKIRVYYENTDSTYSQMCGISISDNASAEADARVYIENGATRYSFLTVKGSSKDTTRLTHQVSVAKFMGRKSILSEDDFRGDVSNNPAEQVYFHVWAAPHNSVDSGNVNAIVQIDYVAILTEPKTLSLS